MEMIRNQILVTAIVSVLLIASSGVETETAAYWAVEVGDMLEFRAQYLLCNRSQDFDEREMEFDETLIMEITILGNLSLPNRGWIPTDYYSLCRNTLEFPNGTDVHSTAHLLVLGSGYTSSAAMPIGNWSGANEELYQEHLDVLDPYNHSYTLIDDAKTWGWIYGVPEINMTDTRIWSKTDGTLLCINVTNGINERFVSTELAFDLLLERAQPSSTIDLVIIGGSITLTALIIGLIVVLKKRG